MSFMKNILTFSVLLSALLFSNYSFAQCETAGPTIKFSDAQPCTDEDFCIDVSVVDFTDLTALKIPIVWDTSVIEFIGVNDLNLERLIIDDFDLTTAGDGLIYLDWEYENCATATDAITLDDDVVIFKLCFRAKADYGATTIVDITDDNILTNDPEPIIVRRLNVCASNIGLCSDPSYVSTCVSPLELYATRTIGNPGELVRIDVKSRGFRNLNSLQFSMNWDTSIIEFEEVIPSENLVNLNIGQFGLPSEPNIGPGRLTVSWSFIDANQPGTDVADDLTLFTINYRIKGECETGTAVSFTDSPTAIEGINTREEDGQEILSNVPFILTPGEVSVGSCTPEGLLLSTICPGTALNVNDQICIPVTAQSLSDITDINFLMEWNPDILRFTGVRALNTSRIPSLAQNDFNRDNTVNGILELDWRSASNFFNANFNDDDVLFEVCFDVVGFGGNSPFRFDPLNAFVRQAGNFRNLGIFPTNCEVQVNKPQELGISLSREQAPPGDTICMDVTVTNFADLVNAQFSLSWEPTHAQFIEVNNLNPALVGNANIGTAGAASGALTFEWNDAAGLSLSDDEVLFTLCLEVTGTAPGELSQEENCEMVSLIDFPIEDQAISTTSNGNNIGITPFNGEVCVLNPEGYFLVIEEEEGLRNTTECVEFKVVEFDSITSTQFTLNWDPTKLDFESITSPAIPDLLIGTNIDTSSASVGIIGIDWNDPLGLTLPDSAILLDVCYQLIGAAPDCVEIEINSDPNPSVTTLNGAGSVFPLGGSLCIKDTLLILGANITPVTCPDGRDGIISLEVDGGNNAFFYNWRSLTDGSVRVSPEVDNFPVGEVEVTVFTVEPPFLSTTDTFFMPLTDVLPMANAGEDKTLGCELSSAILNGSGSPEGAYSYSWRTIGGEIGGNPNSTTIVARRGGTYILAVTDNETGCAIRDTAQVFSPTLPVADAGRDQFFTCADTVKVLDASNSSPLDSNTTYRWTALSGGLIEPGDETDTAMPTIRTAGVYALEVEFKDTGCTATDTVEAFNLQEFTPISAGPDQELNCDTIGITLFSDIDNAVRDFRIEWFDPAGNSITIDDRVRVNMPGQYVVQATDLENSCVTTDTVLVLPNSAQPVIDLADSTAIDCENPTINLNAQVSNTDSFTIAWESLDGGMFMDDSLAMSLNPTVTVAGTFVLTVTDTTTSCITTDTVVVENNIEEIQVATAGGGDITCEMPSLTLLGGADSTLSISWTLNGDTLSTADTVLATTAGTYYFTALNPESGCSAQDSVVVTSSADLPEITITDAPAITCNDSEVVVIATVSPAEADYTITWTSLEGGTIVSGENTLMPTLGATADYQIEVVNNTTGCTALQQVTIALDTVPPLATAGDDVTLTCAQDSVVLSGLGSSEGASIVYTWSALDGGSPPNPTDALQTTVTAAGTYMLEVRDTLTGCVATDMVMVVPDTALPNVQIAQPDVLTCTMNMVELDGTGSDMGDNVSAAWSALEGQMAPVVGDNPYLATVTDAGAYQLTVTNLQTGCESSATIMVMETRDLPTADAGADVIISCPGSTTAVLDGSGSSQGENFTYQWTSLDGQTVTNPTTLAPSVSQPTTLELVVTNTATGCTASATVQALIDPNLSEADAGQDDTSCGADAAIFATAPGGATGVWSTTGAAIIDIPDGNSTTVGNLQPGENVFVWTLSTADCPNYSSDEVIVVREEAPVANPDALTLDVGVREQSINVQANDVVTAASGATISIVTPPSLGAIDPAIANGMVTYRVAGGQNGEDSFVYEICNSECVELCDQATVSLQVPFDPNYTPTLVNGITPNGDGRNDALIFEALEVDPDAFPDNQLIIFNRWGDIVFEARPYTNNWMGTNTAGQELPQGTYYYILRLDISEGNILKGDITIVK
jgi:gliding motility-associated-like protein